MCKYSVDSLYFLFFFCGIFFLESLILYVQLCKSRYSFKSFNNASNVVSRLSLFEAEFLIGDFL